MKLTDEQIENIATDARAAFWVAMARAAERLGSSSFGGDMLPCLSIKFENVTNEVVEQWFDRNVSDRASKMWKEILRLTPSELLEGNHPNCEHIKDEFRGPDGKLLAGEQQRYIWIDKETGWYFTEGQDGLFRADIDRDGLVGPSARDVMEYLRKNYCE